MILCLWDLHKEAIIDVKIGDTDMDFYKYEPITELLDRWETTKKDKNNKHYND